MEMIKTTGFCEISNDELQMTDGGILIFGITVSGMLLLKVAGVCCAAGLTLGTAYMATKK